LAYSNHKNFEIYLKMAFGNSPYLVWYNTRRVHHAFQNKLSPLQFILSIQANNFNLPKECNREWTYTH